MRDCSHCESRPRDTAFGSVSSGDLAPAGLTSRFETGGNQVGISPLKPGNRAVFLDRDGVLNHAIVRGGKPFPPAGVSDLVINADALDGLTLLKHHGFRLIVVTNQPDVGRGATSMDTVQEIHDALRAAL